MQHVIYLHGFLSSPHSVKAQQTLAFVRRCYPALNMHVPQLSGDIVKAISMIESIVATLPERPLRFIGSSMGGFLSTYFVEKYANKQGAKAVLVNPAVTPHKLLNDFIGEHINPYSQERFTITHDAIGILRSLEVQKLEHIQSYKVLLQTADETLDYRLAEAKYKGADMTIEQGGNHSFIDYDKHLPQIFEFLR
ncbi:YqiA/YcfP family alpha/beta fold hydrolase [Glaciecola sp. SC05]|uniref:YqiA/YcfP family alpha/beta fold hydrolase n=1 Tax=Glaciecola sp. SC05 TaxID=1987355 RepID=UPI003528B061